MARFYARQLRAALAARADADDGAATFDPERYAHIGIPHLPIAVNGAPAEAEVEPAAASAALASATGALGTEAVAVVPETGGYRRRRRRRRGRGGRHETESAAPPAPEAGELPGEPELPPEPALADGLTREVPPSSYLAEMVQAGTLVLPEPRGRRRRGRTGDGMPSTTNGLPALEAPPSPPTARGRAGSVEELLTRQTVLLDLILQRQTALLKTMEQVMTALLRRGGTAGPSGPFTAQQRVAVFVDVPNIVYAADRIGVEIDWGKVLNFLTRNRQLVRATAYAPVTDDPRQRMEMQRFVQPFYNLPYRILTKPLKRFGNGEIKANFDVELAIDVITMADRLDVVCLVSGDGDFRRMVELAQVKGARVEVLAFSSSTASELRTVCDDFIDFNQHLDELCVTK